MPRKYSVRRRKSSKSNKSVKRRSKRRSACRTRPMKGSCGDMRRFRLQNGRTCCRKNSRKYAFKGFFAPPTNGQVPDGMAGATMNDILYG